jgi:hypothetical protein
MGIFKGLKDMRDMVNAAPTMVDQAQQMQANAQQMQYAQQQQAYAMQAPYSPQQAYAQPQAAPAAAGGDVFAPIAGVTVEQYVAVVKGIAAYNYDQNMLPMVAASHGIDAARWAEAAAGFNARVTASPAFAQHFNALYRQA